MGFAPAVVLRFVQNQSTEGAGKAMKCAAKLLKQVFAHVNCFSNFRSNNGETRLLLYHCSFFFRSEQKEDFNIIRTYVWQLNNNKKYK